MVELVDNYNLAVLNDIVLVLRHKVIGLKGGDDAVLNLDIVGIRKIIDVEEALSFLNTVLGKGNNLILLVNDEVACLFLKSTSSMMA